MPRRELDEQVRDALRDSENHAAIITSDANGRSVDGGNRDHQVRSLPKIDYSKSQDLQSELLLRGVVRGVVRGVFRDRVRAVLQTRGGNEDPWAVLDLNLRDLTIGKLEICHQIRYLLTTHYRDVHNIQSGLPSIRQIWQATVLTVPDLFTTNHCKWNSGPEHCRAIWIGRSQPLWDSHMSVNSAAVLTPSEEWPETESWKAWRSGKFPFPFRNSRLCLLRLFETSSFRFGPGHLFSDL